ncbi:thioesterase family protein [Rhodococcus sp. NPDC058521]|uniref:thioesterase family protein n=1 Tax=Rhodococcus sp. NPDC058521 TaxID=3346536 RepID=UPI00366527E9
MSDDAYFVPLGQGSSVGVERFLATDLTTSLWASTMQHGAPPSALLVRALERCSPREGARLTRVVIEILGPIPITELEVHAWLQRPGRNVELVAAELSADTPDGGRRVVASATAWRMATTDSTEVTHSADPQMPARDTSTSVGTLGGMWSGGYLDTLHWSWIDEIGGDGPGLVWVRPKPDLVRGEPLTPMELLFSVADISNGVGAKIDPAEWTFLNTDLTVHVFRVPDGEWIGVGAETSIGPDGVGMCAGILYDECGPVGRIAQTLLVRKR